MAITVACECGWKMPVKDELAGKLISCPLCEGEVVVPEPTAGKSGGLPIYPIPQYSLVPAGRKVEGKPWPVRRCHNYWRLNLLFGDHLVALPRQQLPCGGPEFEEGGSGSVRWQQLHAFS